MDKREPRPWKNIKLDLENLENDPEKIFKIEWSPWNIHYTLRVTTTRQWIILKIIPSRTVSIPAAKEKIVKI